MLGSSPTRYKRFDEINWDEQIFTNLNKSRWRTVYGTKLTPKQYDFVYSLVSTCLPMDVLFNYDESDVMRIYAEVYHRGCDEAAGFPMKDNGRIMTFAAHRNEALRTFFAVKPVIGGILGKALAITTDVTSKMLMAKVTGIILGADEDYAAQVTSVMEAALADTDKYLECKSDEERRELIKARGRIIENAQKSMLLPQTKRVDVMLKLAKGLEEEENMRGKGGLDPKKEVGKINQDASELAEIITEGMSPGQTADFIKTVKEDGPVSAMDGFFNRQRDASKKR